LTGPFEIWRTELGLAHVCASEGEEDPAQQTLLDAARGVETLHGKRVSKPLAARIDRLSRHLAEAFGLEGHISAMSPPESKDFDSQPGHSAGARLDIVRWTDPRKMRPTPSEDLPAPPTSTPARSGGGFVLGRFPADRGRDRDLNSAELQPVALARARSRRARSPWIGLAS
jgi:hypothetical protein